MRYSRSVAARLEAAHRFLQVVRGHRGELIQRLVGALQLLALVREAPFGEPTLGDVLDRQQDDPGLVGALRHQPGVQQHDLAADAGEGVVDFEVVQLRLQRELVAEHLAERRDVPLAVAQGEEDGPDGVLGPDLEGAKEGAIRVGDPELVIEHEKGFAHRVEDVEQQPLCRRQDGRPRVRGRRLDELEYGHCGPPGGADPSARQAGDVRCPL